MRILKLKGKTEEAVMNQIERDYKNNAIVLSTQKEEVSGPFKWFKSPRTVVTIAVKDEDDLMAAKAEAFQMEKESEIKPQKAEDNSEASYHVLMDLKEQMGQLHEELSQLKSQPQSVTWPVTSLQNISEISEEDELIRCIQDKLLNLGIRREVCQKIFEKVTGKDSETMIREIYDALEEILTEKQEMPENKVVFFIGSTGVGKTTTLAKLTARCVLEEHKKVALFTSDTYRIAAVEQLKTYADILGVQLEIIYDEKELPKTIEKWSSMDYIFIDTAGRSHKNEEQVEELKKLMEQVDSKQVYLVLNANTSGKDVKKIIETYEKAASDFDLIITKLDETDETGNVVNISYYAQKPIRYITNGQNVPADICVFNKQDFITKLLGRLNNE